MWRDVLTKTQVEQLEAVQRRAIGLLIIFEVTTDRPMPHQFAMACANISSLYVHIGNV